MSRFALEVSLHWVAVALYLVASVLFGHALVFGHPNRVRWGSWAAAAGLLPHGAALASRWVASGHGPYMLKYEVLSSNAWIAIALTLVFVRRRPALSAVALVVLPVSLLMVAVGLFSNPEIRELPPTLRSIWLVFHVSFAKLSAGAFLLSVATSTLLLLRRRSRSKPWLERLPSPDALDAYTVRLIGFGFIFWTVTVAAGAIWANESWGRYWGWDTVETWSLITWLVYGSFLHARLFFKLKPVPTAGLALGCFVVLMLTILILPYLMPSLHAAYFQ
ncbi:MAG: cytochrome c biogenesis protein CcsA [Myxococcaceae bacterium]